MAWRELGKKVSQLLYAYAIFSFHLKFVSIMIITQFTGDWTFPMFFVLPECREYIWILVELWPRHHLGTWQDQILHPSLLHNLLMHQQDVCQVIDMLCGSNIVFHMLRTQVFTNSLNYMMQISSTNHLWEGLALAVRLKNVEYGKIVFEFQVSKWTIDSIIV